MNIIPLLADMSDADILRIIVRLVIFGVIVGLLWWLVDFSVEHPKLKRVIQIVLAILAVLWLCRELLKITA